jgi:hypothetical protein
MYTDSGQFFKCPLFSPKHPISCIVKESKEFLLMTPEQLAQFKSNYVEMIIDGMDYKTMEMIVYDMLTESYELFTEDEMREEILSHYDEEILAGVIAGNI